MKRNFIKALALGLMMVSGSVEASAQSLGSILQGVASAATGSSSSTGSSVLSGLTSIFSSSKTATAEQLAGTWVYEEPAVVFESSNLLKQAGGTVVSSQIEKKLQTILNKYGIKKGNMTMTFTTDGKFTQTIGKRSVSGTYTIDGTKVNLKYSGTVSQVLGTTQLDGNSLLIVMNTSKLMKFAGVIGNASGNTMLKTAGSLLSGMDGMQCGVRLKKK